MTHDDPDEIPPGRRTGRVRTLLTVLGFYGVSVPLEPSPPAQPDAVAIGGLTIFDAADAATLERRRARLTEPRGKAGAA